MRVSVEDKFYMDSREMRAQAWIFMDRPVASFGVHAGLVWENSYSWRALTQQAF